jgi:hypothetical protein
MRKSHSSGPRAVSLLYPENLVERGFEHEIAEYRRRESDLPSRDVLLQLSIKDTPSFARDWNRVLLFGSCEVKIS